MGAAGAGSRTGGTQLTPTLSLDAIGTGLAAAYDGMMLDAVPERLSALLRELELREARAGGGTAPEASQPDGTGGGAAGSAPGRLALLVGDVPGADEAAALLARAGLASIRCADPDAGLDTLRLRADEVALVLVGLPTARGGCLDGAGLARAIATLWPTIHLVVVQPPRPEARVPDAHLPPQAVPLDRAPDLLALAEHAARNPRPPVA